MISTIISSSVLILIILAIRFIFRGKINPMVQYGIWSLVALRLATSSWLDLHPIESSLSVMNVANNAAETLRVASSVEQVIAGNAEAGTIDNAVLIMENIKTGVMTSGEGISAAASIDWQLVIMIIWAIGAVTLGLWLIHVNRKYTNKLYNSRRFIMTVRADSKGALDYEERNFNYCDAAGRKIKYLSVYVADWLQSPCLMGCKGEVGIYVTSAVAADKKKLRYAITHELCHYRHHDLIWSFVRVGLLAFYWFNPLVWIAAVMSKRDCELACDYGVIKEIGEEEKLIYGKALVDLISDRQLKTNVLRTATTMYGNARDIKERVIMIAKNNRMSNNTFIAILLIAALSVGCTFTSASTNIIADANIADTDIEAINEISSFAKKWADAFTERDGKTIYELCEDEELYLTIGELTENGGYSIGSSSPWPWYKDYVIDIVDPSTAKIYYHFRTSDPTVYVAKETVSIKEVAGEYKATETKLEHFDSIESKVEFDEAYKHGFPDFTALADAYQFQADGHSGLIGKKEILENPVTAAIDQLHLTGAKVAGIYEDPNVKKAVIKLAWDDGEATISLMQPMLTEKDGSDRQATIWIVVDENDPNSLLFNKKSTPSV